MNCGLTARPWIGQLPAVRLKVSKVVAYFCRCQYPREKVNIVEATCTAWGLPRAISGGTGKRVEIADGVFAIRRGLAAESEDNVQKARVYFGCRANIFKHFRKNFHATPGILAMDYSRWR